MGKMNKNIFIYTDGSCKGNPGDGGYCAILKQGEHEKIVKGYVPETTNNIMELLAVIKGIEAIKVDDCNITVRSDSQYICNAFNKGWLEAWESSNWIKSDKKPVANKELWEILINLIKKHNFVSFEWVQGHSNDELNNRCDKIAQYMASHHCVINGEIREFELIEEIKKTA